MRYLKAVGIGVFVFLFLNGVQAVSDNKTYSQPNEEKIIFVDTADNNKELQVEVERLRSLVSIREVLEIHLRGATLDEKRELAETILEACSLFDLDVELVLAVIQVESSFNATAQSHKGAMGLMQLMPRTGWAMSEEMELQGFNYNMLFDTRTNVMLGTYYLKKLIDRYDNLEKALLAYNAGPTLLDRVLSNNKNLPQTYANKVRGKMKRISQLHFFNNNSIE